MSATDDGQPYISASKIRKQYAVANNTLRGFANSGRVRAIRLSERGKRLYSLPDIRRLFQLRSTTAEAGAQRKKIVYCRVSSQKQKEDLVRQRELLSNAYPSHEVVKDIGSGINFNRRGLVAILERAVRGELEEVVVAHRDRLCRIAFELVETVLRACHCRLVVHEHALDAAAADSSGGESSTAELQQDLLAIVTLSPATTALVQHIVDSELAQQHQQKAATRRAEQMTKKKRSQEQMAAVEARCSKKAAVAAVKAGTVARRVVLFPTKEQKHQLQKAFEACRWVYNKCVEALNANKKTAIKALRERFVNKAAWGRICSEVDVEWADIPYEVRDGALRDAIKAKTSTEAHLDNEAAVAGKPESTKKWVFKFRKKKEIIESLQLRKRDLNGGNAWFARLFGTKGDRSATRTKSGNCLPSQFASDVRLIHDKRLGVYSITIAVLPCCRRQPSLLLAARRHGRGGRDDDGATDRRVARGLDRPGMPDVPDSLRHEHRRRAQARRANRARAVADREQAPLTAAPHGQASPRIFSSPTPAPHPAAYATCCTAPRAASPSPC